MMGLNTHMSRRTTMALETTEYIQKKFNLDLNQKSPIEIRNYGRNNLAELFSELGFKRIVEVGVCDGTYSKILLKANPQATVYGVDPFIPYKEYGDYQRKSSIDRYHEKAKKLLEYPNYVLIEKFSVEAAKTFLDESVDAVYIDANHKFEFVVEDIKAWLPKIRKGGILAGHDYAKIKQPTNTHVYQAVNGYTESHQIKWFLIGTKAMLPGEVRDSMRSFMWVC